MYTAEDTLRYVTRSSPEEEKFLRWLRRQKREEKTLRQTYSLKEAAFFLDVTPELLGIIAKIMKIRRLDKNSGYSFTSEQIARARKHIVSI